MDIILRYFDGCPNWIDAESNIRQALETLGEDADIVRQRIETMEDALAVGFTGSPTILVNNGDPFAIHGAEPGLACRLYPTPDGLSGTPTVDQLLAALLAARG
jgi:hypothetical protein